MKDVLLAPSSWKQLSQDSLLLCVEGLLEAIRRAKPGMFSLPNKQEFMDVRGFWRHAAAQGAVTGLIGPAADSLAFVACVACYECRCITDSDRRFFPPQLARWLPAQ